MRAPVTQPKPEQPWQPTPYAARASQHVGVMDYLKRGIFKLLMGGATGAAIGMAIDRLRGNSSSKFAQIGGIIGSTIGGYFAWRRQEETTLAIDEVLQDYTKVPGLMRTNEEVAQDNAILTKIVEHQREKLGHQPAVKVEGADKTHHGAMQAPATQQVSA